MVHIQPLEAEQASKETRELYNAVQKKLGRIPNLMKTLGHSQAALGAYLNFSNTLAGGVLPAKVREQIAIAVAEMNNCEYCLSAHTAIGKMVGLEDDEIIRNRQVSSKDPKVDAMLKFAQRIVKKRGFAEYDDLKEVRAAGNTEAEIVEVVANVALNIFTNYFNHVAATEVDFPKVCPLEQVA